MNSRQQLLKDSWDIVAATYDRELVPKFEPWLQDTLKAFTATPVPAGTVYAPCCGAGNELLLLADALPASNTILGVDLSEQMVAISNSKAEQAGLQGRVSATAGDAAQTPPGVSLAGVFSIFGLQQMQPEPAQALKAWLAALQPGGKAVVCYWPDDFDEANGPWRTYDQISTAKRPPSNTKPYNAQGWDEGIVSAALEVPGVQLQEDRIIVHEMRWDSIEHMWKVMTEGGPWHTRMLQYGDTYKEQVKAELFARVPAGSLLHLPKARLLAFSRIEQQSSQARM